MYAHVCVRRGTERTVWVGAREEEGEKDPKKKRENVCAFHLEGVTCGDK